MLIKILILLCTFLCGGVVGMTITYFIIKRKEKKQKEKEAFEKDLENFLTNYNSSTNNK